MPEPPKDILVDVQHDPGYRMPEPVRHIKYKESHPVFKPGEVAVPAGAGAYCPPGF